MSKAAQKTSVKKTAAKKTASKKAVKKAVVKKAVKKTAAKKTTAKKTAKKTVAKKAVKKTTVKKTVKKTAVKKAVKKTVKKTVSKKTTGKKVVKKTTVKTSRKRVTNGNTVVTQALMEVEAAKYQVSPSSESATEEDLRELDNFYGETHATLLVRDPYWIYVFWEINDATREQFLIPRGAHSGQMMLRWYDVTDLLEFNGSNAHHTIDTDISDDSSSWYQHVPESNRCWCVDLGVIGENGDFLPICRSNTVQTPRDSLAQEHPTARWMRAGLPAVDHLTIRVPSGSEPDAEGNPVPVGHASHAETMSRAKKAAKQSMAKNAEQTSQKQDVSMDPASSATPEESPSRATASHQEDQLSAIQMLSSEALGGSFSAGMPTSAGVMRPDLEKELRRRAQKNKK